MSRVRKGVYRPSVHLERARAAIERIGGDPEAFVRSHVRQLEALRRACHAERIEADHWRVPADLPERGQAYDLEWFSVDVNRNSKGVPKGAQIRFGLL